MNSKERIIEISKKHELSHVGSCLSAVTAIEVIYDIKKPDEKFILSNGHAALALYVVLEKYHLQNEYGVLEDIWGDAETLLEKYGVHPQRDEIRGIYCSTGSLGQGLPIAVGMALTDRKKNVYCMISDGEMAEGSIWEALRTASDQDLYNLKVVMNANGWAAYDKTDIDALITRVKSFGWTVYECDDDPRFIKYNLRVPPTKFRPTMVINHTNSDIEGFSKGLESHYKTWKS
jgi:transketolase